MKRAITKRMDVVESNIQELFTNLYCKKDFEVLLKIAKKAKADRQPFVLRKLARMLNDVGQTCEYGKSVSYYEKEILNLNIPADTDELNQRLVDTLSSIYATYPQPDEFMQRIVEQLDGGASKTDSLQLRILKRFMKTVNVKENKKYYSKTLARKETVDIDESIFNVLDNNPAEKCDYIPLVQAAYNLAKGNFVSPVTTKELLFLFAFAYDMRYYSSTNDNNYNLQRDVERNLFEDYYCDNLTRYIYSEDGGKSGNSDKEPTGIGVNPKNYIDVIFIYYLNLESMETSQKVARFYTMISKVRDAWKSKYEYVETRKNIYEDVPTGTYRNKIQTILNGMDEDAFEKYLLDNYYCDVRYTYTNKKTGGIQEGSKGPFELQFAANSAYKQYCLILDLIREELSLPGADFSKVDLRVLKDVSKEEAFIDLYTNENSKLANRFCELEMNVPDSSAKFFQKGICDSKERKEFVSIIKGIEKRLNPYEALSVTNPESLTRTKMIAAYYHYHCLKYSVYDCEEDWQSFKDVLEEMKYCLNDYLEDAGYQKISSKNLYDVFVIFFAYCKINNFLS